MPDPIEIVLEAGLNSVKYKKNNDIVKDIVVADVTELFLKDGNEMTSIGTLKEVKKASGLGTYNIKSKDGKKIGTIPMIGEINITLYAEPPPSGNTGGKRKTRKYKRKTKGKSKKNRRKSRK